MKILSIILIISVMVMGYFDEGNMTAALIVAAVLGLPVFSMSKKEGR